MKSLLQSAGLKIYTCEDYEQQNTFEVNNTVHITLVIAGDCCILTVDFLMTKGTSAGDTNDLFDRKTCGDMWLRSWCNRAERRPDFFLKALSSIQRSHFHLLICLFTCHYRTI